MKLFPSRSFSVTAGAFLVVLAISRCASTPPAVPVEGAAGDLSALAGHWEGEYESPATGRLGSIVFDLTSGEDHAHGDVFMIPRGSTKAYGPAPVQPGQSPSQGATSQLLTIRFVKAEGGKVSGTLDPYWDPDCNCEVTTTFVGEVRGNTVAGTFSSSRNAGRVFGTWKVTRKT